MNTNTVANNNLGACSFDVSTEISSNKRIATVDSSGVIKGIRPGTVTITVKTTDTSEINKTISITVNQK